MEVLLVRHGQTANNVVRRHQDPDIPLTVAGEQQAMRTAKTLQNFEPDYLFTSPYKRAVQSASFIAATTGVDPVIEPLVIELQHPNYLHGQRLSGLPAAWYIWRWWWSKALAVESQGETKAEFLDRIEAVYQKIESLPPESRVVIVSHSVFINFMLLQKAGARPISFYAAIRTLIRILRHQNSGIYYLVGKKKSVAKFGRQYQWRVGKYHNENN